MIDSCDSYKYLGDMIMKNGANRKNLEERENKVMARTRKILALCSTEVFQKTQLKSLLQLHNSCTVAGLLTNCETWVLNKAERGKLERIELWALKKIPKTTPTAAIWHVMGMMITSILIDKRQMLYLKNILNKPSDNWTKQIFISLREDDIGWAKQIWQTLEVYGVSATLEEIKEMPSGKWRKLITAATEMKQKERLIEMCNGRGGEKTKTKELLENLNTDTYARAPCMKILTKSKYQSRVLIMAKFHMLNCAKNFKTGYKGENCNLCEVLDDENHRINFCKKYANTNLFQSSLKIDFHSVFSNDPETIQRILLVVCEIWDVENGRNEMR